MQLCEYDYNLPKELIAQLPADKRENSGMMVLSRENHTIEHKYFYDIVDCIDGNSLLVLNNTKVLPARLYGVKEKTGAKIEVFLLKNLNSGLPCLGSSDEHSPQILITSCLNGRVWEALIKPSKRVKPGTVVKISDELRVRVLEKKDDDGEWIVELLCKGDILDVLHKYGNIPLPPYIERNMADERLKKLDYERYQTVYAKDEGSVAAPTAGLHFTKEILKKLREKGVQIVYITLDVGIGTFRPVKCENISDHKMHSETFEITEEAAERINKAKKDGRKIIAAGTTSVRTLETAFKKFGKIIACKDHTDLFIYPPYKYEAVDELITNFHLPKSTLLMLVCAFAGKDFIFDAYKEAVERRYRFFSYGDCMYIK